jgi:hypothetical protein
MYICLNFNYRILVDSLPRILKCHITCSKNLRLIDTVDYRYVKYTPGDKETRFRRGGAPVPALGFLGVIHKCEKCCTVAV